MRKFFEFVVGILQSVDNQAIARLFIGVKLSFSRETFGNPMISRFDAIFLSH